MRTSKSRKHSKKKEEWSPIPGHDHYLVSSGGRVKSTNDKGNWGNGRIMKIIQRKSGYCVVNLYSYGREGKRMKQYRVHILVAKAFVPNPENKPFINHKNGIKTDNRACNLEWCTHSENMTHAYRNGLTTGPAGETNGMASLTGAEVKEIRKRAASGGRYYGRKSLAEKYGVSETCISDIVTRKRWAHI